MIKSEQQIKNSICQIFENDKNFVTCSVMDKGGMYYVDLVHEKPGRIVGRNGRYIKVISTMINIISKKNSEIRVMDNLHQKRQRMLARHQEILVQYSMGGML